MPAIAVSATSSAQSLSAKSAKSSSSNDLAAAVFRQFTVAVAAAVEESCDTRTSKSAFSQVSLVVGTLAAFASTDNLASDVIIIVITVVAVVTTSAVISLNGVVAVSAGVAVLVAIVILLLRRAMSVLVSVLSMLPSNYNLLSFRLSLTDDNYTRLLLLARRNDDWSRGRSFLNNDLLWFRRTLSNNYGGWRRRWVVRGVVFRLLAVSLNVTSMGVVDMFLDTLLNAVIAVISAFSPDHLVLNLDVLVEQSVKARSSVPVTLNFLGLYESWRTRSISNLRRRRHWHRWGWRRISLSFSFFFVNVRSRSRVSATVLVKTSMRGSSFKGGARAIRDERASVVFNQVARRAAIAGEMGTPIIKFGTSFEAIRSAWCDLISSDRGFAIALVV
jgi:hypothetical protein